MNHNHLFYALYPASKSGDKMEECEEVEHGKMIRNVQCDYFYLEELGLTKKSIATSFFLESECQDGRTKKKMVDNELTEKKDTGCCFWRPQKGKINK